MQSGNGHFVRVATAYAVALGFALTFLLTMAFGGGLSAALTRGVIVAIGARVLAPWFVRPVVSTICDAMARDQEAQEAKAEAEAKGDAEASA